MNSPIKPPSLEFAVHRVFKRKSQRRFRLEKEKGKAHGRTSTYMPYNEFRLNAQSHSLSRPKPQLANKATTVDTLPCVGMCVCQHVWACVCVFLQACCQSAVESLIMVMDIRFDLLCASAFAMWRPLFVFSPAKPHNELPFDVPCVVERPSPISDLISLVPGFFPLFCSSLLCLSCGSVSPIGTAFGNVTFKINFCGKPHRMRLKNIQQKKRKETVQQTPACCCFTSTVVKSNVRARTWACANINGSFSYMLAHTHSQTQTLRLSLLLSILSFIL